MKTVELPNGDRVRGSYDWPSDCWTVQLGDTGPAAQGHWLHTVLRELFPMPRRTVSPPWLLDAVQRLAAHDTSLGPRVLCRCCGHLTLTEYGGYEICEVCGWEDDPTTVFERGLTGPNHVSLVDGRRNFAEHGQAKPDRRGRALRRPRPEQRP